MSKFNKHLGALVGGVAVGAVLAGAALADPAIIYDLGGKFDKSFNEAAFNGATRWAEETGESFLEFELTADAQREQALRRFADQGANPIVVMSFMWENVLGEIVDDYPDTNFVVIDAVVDKPNVQSLMFDEHTGSFLVGAIAAMKSETGNVGFIGGMDTPLIHRFYCGYAYGAHEINPDITVQEAYTGTTPAAWNDPVTAGELAMAQMDAGADVVFAAAGGSGLGVMQAMADAGKFSIGVDSNQNHLQPGSVLTSMLKRVDNAVYNSFMLSGDDATFEPGRLDLGLADEGVDYALDEHNADLITDEMQQRVDELKAQVIAGEIEVHDYYTDNDCPL